MSLIERAEAVEAKRRAVSQEHYGHPGASIPGLHFDWKQEALAVERQLREAVCLTLGEAGMLEVLAREEVAKHRHPPHDLVRALDKLRERIERGQ
jgi:hypothetical protein